MVENSTGTAYINIEYEQYQVVELFGRTALFTNGRLKVSVTNGKRTVDLKGAIIALKQRVFEKALNFLTIR